MWLSIYAAFCGMYDLNQCFNDKTYGRTWYGRVLKHIEIGKRDRSGQAVSHLIIITLRRFVCTLRPTALAYASKHIFMTIYMI